MCSQYLSAGLDYLLERGGFYNAYFHSGSIGFRFREDDFVAVGGFGSFIVKKRAKKVARNISKNTTITIPEHNIPAFKPAKSFAAKVK